MNWFESTCTKLHVFNMTDLRSALFIDADALLIGQEPTGLFDRASKLSKSRPLAAAPDVMPPTLFNSGVMLVRPNREVFNGIFSGLKSGALSSYDGGDQGILNAYFSEWFSWDAISRLSPRFNLLQHMGRCGTRRISTEISSFLVGGTLQP